MPCTSFYTGHTVYRPSKFINCNTYLPRIHPIVNQWVYNSIGHRKPIERQEDMLSVLVVDNFRIEIYIDEISMVWKPANPKDHDNEDKHFHHLEINKSYKM